MKLLSEIIIKSKNETYALGLNLAKLISPNDVITFNGDLGVGKTFLCKSIISCLTKINEVVSPTFNLVQTYPLKKDNELWHCDFYRISSFSEVVEIGVFEDTKKKLFFLNGQNLKLN